MDDIDAALPQTDLPPLLLLSGLLCDETVWEGVAPRLADIARIEMIAFAGLSSIEAMARRVLHNAPPRFALAGHSMGGRVALEVLRLEPQRVTALALLNTGVHPQAPGETESRGRLVDLARGEGMTALAAQWLPPMMGANAARTAALLPGLTAMVERNTPASFAGQIRALLERPDAAPVLPTIAVPTLLLSGEDDRWSPVSQHADMQTQIANARLVSIADTGHMAPVERPDAVAQALRDWLAATAAGTADWAASRLTIPADAPSAISSPQG
jgi:pimeloyl-ACP methyl ester carboxylesterase